MARCPDLYPPIDPAVEYEPIMFDFGNLLAAGETISSVVQVTITVVTGTDATPNSRVIGSPIIVASQATGAPLSGVIQGFGNMVDGVTYAAYCTVLTNNSIRHQSEVGGHIPCKAPG